MSIYRHPCNIHVKFKCIEVITENTLLLYMLKKGGGGRAGTGRPLLPFVSGGTMSSLFVVLGPRRRE